MELCGRCYDFFTAIIIAVDDSIHSFFLGWLAVASCSQLNRKQKKLLEDPFQIEREVQSFESLL